MKRWWERLEWWFWRKRIASGWKNNLSQLRPVNTIPIVSHGAVVHIPSKILEDADVARISRLVR